MMLKVARMSSAGVPVSMSVIARETDISKSYLEQLAIPLRSAGLLRGRAGRSGGYMLSKPPAEIKVREIVEAVIGPIDVVECVGDPSQCRRSHECQTRLVWALITNRVRSMLEDYSLADLTDPAFMDVLRQQVGTELVVPQPKAPRTCGPVRVPSRKRS
jgi:Rrf2 family protein